MARHFFLFDGDDTPLMSNNVFHDNNLVDMTNNLAKQEQSSTAINSALVSSTSEVNICRQDVMYECGDEQVDSTTNSEHNLNYVPSMSTYHESVDKLNISSIVSSLPSEAHHLLQPLPPQSPHFSDELFQRASDDIRDDDCEQKLSHSCSDTVKREVSQQEHVISDVPVLSRARASLPAAYLYIEHIECSMSMYGVFAKKTIPKRTQFGPVEGVIVAHNHPNVQNHRHNLMIFITETLILDQSDENQSNWMKFVRSASTFEEQNLALVSKEQVSPNNVNELEVKFYFLTTRPINAREELKVWYSKEYSEKFNLKILEPRASLLADNEQQITAQNDDLNDSTAVNNVRKRNTTTTIDIMTTGGHKLRNKIAKTQQQMLNQSQETQQNSVNETNAEAVSESKDSSNQPKHQCETCQKVFPRYYSLRRHMIMHSGEKKYKCPLCGMSFSHVYNRNRHVKRHTKTNNNNANNKKYEQSPNNSNNEIVSTSNGFNWDSEDKKVDVSKIGSNEEQTDKQFDTNAQLMKSQNLMVARKSAPKCVNNNKSNNANKPYRCHECYKSFTTDDRLLRHAIVHSSDEDVKPLACQFCQKRFLNNSALSCHLKVHSTPKDQPRRYDCVICKQWFDSTQIRKDHIITHADPITGQFTCPTCSKSFDEFSAVRKHIRAFHSDKQYPCTQCEKVFPRPDKLKLHMLRHSDHREFLCANCGKQFKRKDKLKEHMQRMHAPDRELKLAAKQAAKQAQQQNQNHKKFVPKVSPTDYHRFIYKCHACLLGFKRRGMLVNHLAKRHPDIPPDSVPELNLPILKTTRDYYCQYCDKIYKSSSKRKAHIIKNHPGKSLPLSNRHKGGIPVIPGVPNPTYSTTVGSITTHPHYCDWCHKQYASKAKLLQHQRKKHPEQMAIINTNARIRHRTVSTSATVVSTNAMPLQTQTQQTTNIMTNTAPTVALTAGVTASNLITILGNLNLISATMNGSDLSQSTASSADFQELLQGSTNDLLTQAMSELTATKTENGATLIITAQPTADGSWNQVCDEIASV